MKGRDKEFCKERWQGMMVFLCNPTCLSLIGKPGLYSPYVARESIFMGKFPGQILSISFFSHLILQLTIQKNLELSVLPNFYKGTLKYPGAVQHERGADGHGMCVCMSKASA